MLGILVIYLLLSLLFVAGLTHAADDDDVA